MDFSANEMTHEVTLELEGKKIVLLASMARLADLQQRVEAEGLGETIKMIQLLDARVLLAGLVALSGSKNAYAFNDMHASVPVMQVVAGALATALTLGMPEPGADRGNGEAPTN